MARSRYGGTSVDWLLKPYNFGSSTLVALKTGTTLLNFYSTVTGGTHYTDLLDADNNPVTQVTVSGHQVPEFDGPDGILGMWADKGDGSPREYMATTDTAAIAAAVVEAEDAATAAAASAATAGSAATTAVTTALGASTLAGAIGGSPTGLVTTIAGKVAKGELIYRVTDYASLSAALTAIPAGATLYIPAGTTVSANSILFSKDVTVVGDGPRVSIIDAASDAYGFAASSSAARVTFRNIGFTGSTSAIFVLSRAGVYSATFIDCKFSGFAAVGIQTFGTDVTCVRCDFSTDGTPGTANAVQHLRGSQYIHLQDCTFRYLYRGLYCTDTDGPATNVLVEGCTLDGGWMYLKSTASSSGGAVTYAATTLTDTAASFGSLVVSSTVRAMASKQAGTITAISNTKITDSAANFTTAGVLPGDILRTSTGWGVVDEVVSTTVVKIEQWLSLTTYDSIVTPATSTAYTIYGLVLGKVVSNTGTVITVDAWRNWAGTIATPSAGTLYELAPKSDYQCYVYRADKVRIRSNTFRRTWADAISAQLTRNAIITDNNIYDCQDVGITVGQPSGTTLSPIVANNRIIHVGSAGIWLGNVYDTRNIHDNSIYQPNWMSVSGATYAGITVEQCTRVGIHDNLIQAGSMPNATKAIHLNGTPGASVDIDLTDNQTNGYATQDIMITGSNVTGTTGKFQRGTVITLVSSAVGPLGEFSGAGTPESVVPAAIGSTFRRTNGGAGTSFYIKETGAGTTTGWVGK